MAITRRSMEADPEEVFGALLDPYMYAEWVVGAKSIRGADEHWPAVGSAFNHRIGAGEAEVKDKSEILELDSPNRIALRTFVRPFGIARVVIEAAREGDGRARVSIFEEPEIGTRMRLLARLVDPLIHLRNVESLRRLERVIRIRRSGASSSNPGR